MGDYIERERVKSFGPNIFQMKRRAVCCFKHQFIPKRAMAIVVTVNPNSRETLQAMSHPPPSGAKFRKAKNA